MSTPSWVVTCAKCGKTCANGAHVIVDNQTYHSSCYASPFPFRLEDQAATIERLEADIAEWKSVFENFRSLNAELRLRNADLQGHANVLAAHIAEMEAAPAPNIESAADRLTGLHVSIGAGLHNYSGTLNKQSRIAVARAVLNESEGG